MNIANIRLYWSDSLKLAELFKNENSCYPIIRTCLKNIGTWALHGKWSENNLWR